MNVDLLQRCKDNSTLENSDMQHITNISKTAWHSIMVKYVKNLGREETYFKIVHTIDYKHIQHCTK